MKNKQVKLDPLYLRAKMIVLDSKNTSISYLQRTLIIGYMRSSSIMMQLELMDVVSSVNKDGTRHIL